MQGVDKFDWGFFFYELDRNALLLNIANRNYFKEPIYIRIFFLLCYKTQLVVKNF